MAEKWVRDKLLVSYDVHEKHHEAMLKQIVASAVRSPIYAGRLGDIIGISSLSDLPLTDYDTIFRAMEESGEETVLLEKPERFFHTSGSTGTAKRFHYSTDDIRSIVDDYVMFTHIIGMDRNDIGWNFGGSEPLVSGLILDGVANSIPLAGCITTLLGDDSDLVSALKHVCKADRVDVMAGAAIVFYIIGRISRDPDYLISIVRHRLHEDYMIPRHFTSLIARLYLTGMDRKSLIRIANQARIGISYAETLGPYMQDLKASFPNIHMHDVYGSTENPLIAAQFKTGDEGLSVFLNSLIPEIAKPEDVLACKDDPNVRVAGVPWNRWYAGLRGELLITRPGHCLPLVRYPTGDIIEVIDPAGVSEVRIGEGVTSVVLPRIKVLGRSTDVIDFEVEDESGNFLGNKIYSRHISEAMHSVGNVRWWELYNIKGSPARLVFLIIPEKDVSDRERYGKEILHHLLRECDDLLHTLKVGHDLGRVDVKVCNALAFSIIQDEIDRRMREGRTLGQMKPKHIIRVNSEAEFETCIRSKMQMG
jgi:phenylacetate-coenzyme A ligase PaaK-like adenylate-forming protein